MTSHWNFNPAGCGCCQQQPTNESPTGSWLCGRCSRVPIRYKLTVPDTSLAALEVSVLAPVTLSSFSGPRTGNIRFNHRFPSLAEFGGEHILRRARSNTAFGNGIDEPFESPPYIDDDGYFVFPYNRTTHVAGSNQGSPIIRDIRPCSWFGDYTDHGYSFEYLPPHEDPITASGLGVDHCWRLRMDYNAYVVRVEGPSSFTNWPQTLFGDDGALNYHQSRIGVIYEIPMAEFQCMGTTILPYATDNPRATGWPPAVMVEAIEDEETL